MNKKGIGMGPAIALSVILLVLFLIGTSFLLGYGRENVTRIAKINIENLEVDELLFDLLNEEIDNLNVADLIGLKRFEEVGNVVKEKLPKDIGWSFRIYGPDFKNVLQSRSLYVFNNDIKGEKEFAVVQKIENYFNENLHVYLSVRK